MSSDKLKKMEISARISVALSKSGKKSKEVAAEIGISEVTMSKYTTGVSTPKNAYLISLARALNVSVSWLLTGEEQKPREEDYWKDRALAAEQQLLKLQKVMPLIAQANAILSDFTPLSPPRDAAH